MIHQGYAVEYDGGKKHIPKEWQNKEINVI
jgi:hypothetical protein